MNIAGYMAACDIGDLDRSAKAAVQAVAGRANQRTGVAWVSIGRLARDMGVAYNTARFALERAAGAGYLAVEKTPGVRPRWQLTSLTTAEVAESSVDEVLINHRGGPRQPPRTKDVLRTSEGRADVRSTRERADVRSEAEQPARGYVDPADLHPFVLDELGFAVRRHPASNGDMP